MGTLYTTYFPSGLGAPGTFAYRTNFLALLAQRMANCPFERATTYYIAMTGGAPTTGAGTLASPYIAIDGDDMVSWIAARLGTGNVAFLLRKGTTFRLGEATTLLINQPNVTIGSYADSPSQTSKPHITGFQNEANLQAGAWTSEGSGTFSKTFSGIESLTHVRDANAAVSALDAGTEVPYLRCASINQVKAATSRAYFLDLASSPGNTIAYVKRTGASPAAVIDMSWGSTNSGIVIQNVDGSRVDGISVTGCAFQIADNGLVGIVADVGGTQEAVICNCSIFYCGASHGTILLGAASATSGGIVTWHNNKMGLCRYTSAAYLITAYKPAGDQECIRYGNDAVYGAAPEYADCSFGTCAWDATARTLTKTGIGTGHTFVPGKKARIASGTGFTAGHYELSAIAADVLTFLPAAGLGTTNADTVIDGILQPFRRGGPDYSHTGGSGPTAALDITWGQTTRNNTYGCAQPCARSDDTRPYTTHHLNMASYVNAIVDEIFEGGAGTNPQGAYDFANTVCLNRKIKVRPYPSWPASEPLFYTSRARSGVRINCRTEVDEQDIAAASGNTRAHQAGTSSTEPVSEFYCSWHIKGRAALSFLWDGSPEFGYNGTRKRFFDCLFSVSVSASALNLNHAPNVAAGSQLSDTPTGGMQRCAFYLVGTTVAAANVGSPPVTGDWGVNNAACNNVNLSALPSIDDAAPVAGGPLYRVGSLASELPIVIEHDATWRPRSAVKRRSVGPLDAASGGGGQQIVGGQAGAVLAFMDMI